MNPTSPQEEHLVLALRGHRSADFSRLYDAYAPALYVVLLRLVKEPAWAEDLLQDTFVKVWFNHAGYDPFQGRLFPWMVRIARNVALDALRAQKSRRAGSGNLANPADKVTHPKIDQGMVYQTLLSQLAPKHRTVIELMYYQGYTGQEVATSLDMPLGTVKTWARVALQQLKVYFKQDIHHYQAS